jgi:hyperosmotically inducible periplasmic protein
MNSLAAMLTGTGLGCLAMYSLDPEVGRRRRAQARYKILRIQKKAGEAAAARARDLKNRTRGTVAEGRSLLFDGKVNDEKLADRVRSNLGFLVRYPSFIDVQVNNGRVVLSGSVFADEVEQLIDGVLRIRGVRKGENRLNVYEKAENFPGRQGEVGELRPKPEGRRIDLFQHHWSPSTKLIVGLLSAGLLCLGALAYGRSEAKARRASPAAKLADAVRQGEKFIRSMRR